MSTNPHLFDPAEHGMHCHASPANDGSPALDCLIDDDRRVARDTVTLRTIHDVSDKAADIDLHRGNQFDASRAYRRRFQRRKPCYQPFLLSAGQFEAEFSYKCCIDHCICREQAPPSPGRTAR